MNTRSENTSAENEILDKIKKDLLAALESLYEGLSQQKIKFGKQTLEIHQVISPKLQYITFDQLLEDLPRLFESLAKNNRDQINLIMKIKIVIICYSDLKLRDYDGGSAVYLTKISNLFDSHSKPSCYSLHSEESLSVSKNEKNISSHAVTAIESFYQTLSAIKSELNKLIIEQKQNNLEDNKTEIEESEILKEAEGTSQNIVSTNGDNNIQEDISTPITTEFNDKAISAIMVSLETYYTSLISDAGKSKDSFPQNLGNFDALPEGLHKDLGNKIRIVSCLYKVLCDPTRNSNKKIDDFKHLLLQQQQGESRTYAEILSARRFVSRGVLHATQVFFKALLAIPALAIDLISFGKANLYNRLFSVTGKKIVAEANDQFSETPAKKNR